MSKPTAIVPNPLAAIAARWTPSPRTVRLAALAALLMSIVIIVTGGAVRLTGSGLGCDTWPKCSGDSLIATREMGLHGAIEFGNRMLTYVLTAAVGWTIIAARSAKPRRRSLTRLGWLQFFVVLANAVLGGITVLLELNPYIVAGHFLAATALLTVTAVTWERTGEGDGAPRPLAGPRVRALAWALAAVTAVLVVAGTVVTGAGPHAGDSSEVPRMGVDWETVTRVHALLAWAVVLLTAALWVVLRAVDAPAAPRRRIALLMAVLLAQGAIGYVQYLTDLPEVLVGLHMLGSCLVWVGVIRVLLSLRERPAVAAEPPVPPAPRQEGPAVAAAL
ncbi:MULTISPECIES: COX15/CtaA family protein [Streptomyces]|uniref:Heme A synthase n=2 Tax=Streptomyces TaxID=1883 RepID=A0A3R7I8V7_9ACTN|nr:MULTISPECIES: COX15/CtaA family protein [Streptomyces]KNE83630.1 cytochrome B561 [Streptomyces fradiae]OFA53330.1 cytochrome B [Streptomyces fradiae]PQM25258.1 heme A synthase [Streptomyces xinghaiensis]RKM99310.1 heme A synthase [Streptomyces xinghaiensis]RNC75786.1 heme A synthase [Streptomyces xinghaiensis]